jgi:hypothetical protein
MKRRKPESPLKISMVRSLVQAMENSTGRGNALLACAWLDDALELYLRSRCVNDRNVESLYESGGPLDAFMPRIKVAYAFGLITEDVFRELSVIRRIRNDFAHLRDPLTFEDSRISAGCRKLQIPALVERAAGHDFETDQDRYMMACFLLATRFFSAAERPHRPSQLQPISISRTEGVGGSVESLAVVIGMFRRARHPRSESVSGATFAKGGPDS